MTKTLKKTTAARKIVTKKRKPSATTIRKGKRQTKMSKELVLTPVKANEPFIKKFFNDQGMCQIYSSGVEFAFVNKQGEQCHPFAYCKDFLHDAVWAQLNNKPVSIYGFSYQPGKNPVLDFDNMCLAARDKTVNAEVMKQRCEKAVAYLNALEKDIGFEPSTLSYGGSQGSDVWVFTSDKRWLFSTVHVSAYSLLMRIGMTYEGGDWRQHLETRTLVRDNDGYYASQAKKGIDTLFSKQPQELFGNLMIDNYPAGVECHSLHDQGGIVSFSTGRSEKTKIATNWKVKKA